MSHKSVWMHIGAGSFHRAHQAWYLHRLIQQGDNSWYIALGNIRSDASSLLDQLNRQQGQYVLETVSPEGIRNYETITSIQKILQWDEKLSALIEQGCQENTKVISFTVTEAGYYLTPQHELDLSQADIQTDINGGTATIYGALEKILTARVAANGKPVTLLNCDNLRHNGERFRHGFLSFLKQKNNLELSQWVEKNTSSPNTMVDRITPRPTADIAERVKAATGFDDHVPVMGESFIQWVIEDNFINGRPKLEEVEVEMVDSVLPWEEAKIRILNASHSCIAWAGTLIGLNYIDESTIKKPIYQMAWNYVTENVIPCLSPSPLNLAQYRDVVLSRFSNPYIKDTNQRVAADGLSKIPGFITPTLNECYQKGITPAATAILPALFFVFFEKWAKDSLPYAYQDGVLDTDMHRKMMLSEDALQQFITDKALFGDLSQSQDFQQLMIKTVADIRQWLTDPY